MAYKTPAQLKARFEGGDVPTQQDFADFIESVHDGVVKVQASGGDDTAIVLAAAALAGDQGTVEGSPGVFNLTGTLDLGKTNFKGSSAGWGDTVFSFSGLSASEDGVVLKSNNNDRTQSGRLENLSILSADGGGRNGVWYQGGRFGHLRDVSIYDWGGIGLLCKQEVQGDWVENFRLQSVEINGCAGYGIQIETVTFADGTGQFWNQLVWDNVKVRNCTGGDLRINLADTNSNANVRVGTLLMNQVQFTTDADRANTNSIVIDKGASASGTLKIVSMNACTLERVLFPTTDFVFKDNSSGGDGIENIIMNGCNTAGYTKAAADRHAVIDNTHAVSLDVTSIPEIVNKSSIQTLGTTPSIEGTQSVPGSGTYDLFSTTASRVYLVLAKTLTISAYAYSLVITDSANSPTLVSLAQSGNITITNSTSTIRASNSGGGAVNIHWTMLRIL